MKIKNNKLIFQTMCILISSIFLFLLLIALILNPWSSAYPDAIINNPLSYNYGVPQTKIATQQLLSYIWFGSNYTVELSQQAQAHMSDVRKLFVVGQICFFMTLILTFWLLHSQTAEEKKKILRISAYANILLLAIIGVFAFFDFNAAFISFHKLFFSNQLWLFPANDSLVIYFPDIFFKSVFISIVFWLIACCCTIIVFTSNWTKKRLHSGEAAQHI